MLGIYESEILEKPQSELVQLREKFSTSAVDLSRGRNLMHALKIHHEHQAPGIRRPNSSAPTHHHPRYPLLASQDPSERLQLGQTVLVKRRPCMKSSSASSSTTDADVQTFFGVVIEIVDKGWESSFRLRNIIMKTGVELKIPVYSPLVETIQILKQPPANTTTSASTTTNTTGTTTMGPNLFKVRESPEALGRYLEPTLLHDKTRQLFMKKMEKGDFSMLDGESTAGGGQHARQKRAAETKSQ